MERELLVENSLGDGLQGEFRSLLGTCEGSLFLCLTLHALPCSYGSSFFTTGLMVDLLFLLHAILYACLVKLVLVE